jgi:hypothetical protein
MDMSAIGFSAPREKGFAPSVFAEWRHDHLVFERQQSQALRAMEWEDRVKPLTPWSALIMRAVGMTIVAAILLAFIF